MAWFTRHITNLILAFLTRLAAVTIDLSECLKVPRNPTNFAFICTQVGLILDIFLFFVCKKHYFEK